MHVTNSPTYRSVRQRIDLCRPETDDRFFVRAVVILAVAGEHSLHDSTDWVVLHLDQQVNVVGHQAIGIQIERQLQFLLLKNAGEPEIVVVRAECLSAIVPASDDVVEPSADLNARFSWHDGPQPTLIAGSNVKKVKPDPF